MLLISSVFIFFSYRIIKRHMLNIELDKHLNDKNYVVHEITSYVCLRDEDVPKSLLDFYYSQYPRIMRWHSQWHMIYRVTILDSNSSPEYRWYYLDSRASKHNRIKELKPEPGS